MNYETREDIFDALTQGVQKATNLPEKEKKQMLQNILHLRSQRLNIMITGGTGVGKSSTINALFDANIAKVGVGSSPETMDIKKYELKNLILWDSPGLGDGKEADARHSRNIINKLQERDANGNALIDLVLVILDGSTRDYGTSFSLINDVIIPNLGNSLDKKNRILVAINQCDAAMKRKYWNFSQNKPEPKLEEFLNEKVKNVHRRIKESTGVDVEPIYYSAGYKESDDEKQNPYNLSKLLYFIIQHTPEEKRVVLVDTPNKNKEHWESNQKPPETETPYYDYNVAIKKNLFYSVATSALKGAVEGGKFGGEIGKIFGNVGEKIGNMVGGFAGAVKGALDGFFSWFGG